MLTALDMRLERALTRVRQVRILAAFLCGAGLIACGSESSTSVAPAPGVQRMQYASAQASLTIEILADDVVHFEFAAAGAGSVVDAPIYTTPMVVHTDYPGPTRFTDDGHGGLATPSLEVTVNAVDLCLTVTDTAQQPPVDLTTICPETLTPNEDVLTIAPNTIRHVYGLGEHFITPGMSNGDWVGTTLMPGNENGNDVASFNGGVVGNAQFPIMYALGDAGENYALFLDHLYAQSWDFTPTPWEVRTSGAQVRGYFLAGPDLPALRRRYMELVGRPLVPPRKMFGLWISEFGYDNWAELEDKLGTLRANHFPVDGFLLDLQWFGGFLPRPSHMGGLTWNTTRFPDPAAEIAKLRDDDGIGLMLIEEPYVDESRPDYLELANRGYLVRQCDGCSPVGFDSWWGAGGMLDWTDDAIGDYWHDSKRQPLVEMGILGHWTDLGEPESYDPGAWYVGFPQLNLHADRDVHNLYNFKWLESIYRGYLRHGRQRPFCLSRSGTSGIQRFGAAMWSGDIGSNLSSLATHYNVQMHMSFSGIDYFGADIGGYWRAALQGDLNDVYTRWFADGMLLDVPGRPHTLNLCNCYQTAPDRVGDTASNLENARLRYRLIPYLYSLAHRAYLSGEPVMPPLVFSYQSDPAVRELGDEKLLGRDLLVATESIDGSATRDVYLPAGTWTNFHTNERITSTGEWIRDVALRVSGVFRLPLFARAGAIIPEMVVDEQTMNAEGRRQDGSERDDLVVRVYPDETASSFTLYEDDGTTTDYETGAVRTTRIEQRETADRVTVSIAASSGTFDGALPSRVYSVEVIPETSVLSVSLNGDPLTRRETRTSFDAAERGWYAEDGVVFAKSGQLDVARRKTFEFHKQ